MFETIITTQHDFLKPVNPAGNYMFKVNNRNTRARGEICSKLTIKTPVDANGDKI